MRARSFSPTPWYRPVLAGVLVLALTGCASIIHGTTQQVAISSSPTGAQVSVNNQDLGTTPIVADLKRKETHIVRVTLAGYEPYEVGLTRSVSGWVWGNIVFGGIIGLAVDAITGGLYKLSPEQLEAELARSGSSVVLEDDAIVVTAVMRPVPGAERIGTLQRR